MRLVRFNGQKGYKKLSHFPFNRNYRVRKDLMDSIEQHGFTVPINLIKTDLLSGREEIYIADGQNRAATASFMNKEFYGTVTDRVFNNVSDLVQYVADLNSTQKKWTLADFINTFAYLKYPEYVELNKIISMTPYNAHTVASMLTSYKRHRGINEIIQDGSFKIALKEETLRTIRLSSKIAKYGKPSARMVLSIHYVSNLRRFNESRFVNMYESNYENIKSLKADDYNDIFASWL